MLFLLGTLVSKGMKKAIIYRIFSSKEPLNREVIFTYSSFKKFQYPAHIVRFSWRTLQI